MKTEQQEIRKARVERKISMAWYEIGRKVTNFLFGWLPKGKQLKAKTKDNIFIWTMLLPSIASFLLFYVYVNFNSILLAFKNIDYANGGVEYWTLDNFRTVLKYFSKDNEGIDFLHYFGNTLKYWCLSMFWSIPHSILMTYVFHKKITGAKIFRVVLYLPSILSGVVVAGIFESFISSNGAVGYVWDKVLHRGTVPAWFQETETATPMLLFYAFFFGFAAHYVIFSGAMAQVSKEITEAALMDGVNMWQEIWYVDIPLMWPTISMTIITTFTGIFGASGAILLFTQYLPDTWTLSFWIFDQVRTHNSYYEPAALGLMTTLIAFPLTMLVKKIVMSIYNYES